MGSTTGNLWISEDGGGELELARRRGCRRSRRVKFA